MALMYFVQDPAATVLSLALCSVSAVAAVVLARFSFETGPRLVAKRLMTAGGLVGMGVWSAHFVAQKADPARAAVPVDNLDNVLTLLLALFVFSASFRLIAAIARPPGWLLAGMAATTSIAILQQHALSALARSGALTIDFSVLAAALLAGGACLSFAMHAIVYAHNRRERLAAGVLCALGLAILIFAGQGATQFEPGQQGVASASRSDADVALTTGIVALVMMVWVLVIAIFRHRNERALIDRRREIDAIFAAIPDTALLMVDPQGRVRRWKASARIAPELRERDIVGRDARDVMLGGGAATVLLRPAAFDKVRETGQHAYRDQRLDCDGNVIDADVSLRAVRDDGGALYGYLQVIGDVTAACRARREAGHAARMLDDVLANIGQGVCLYGPDGRLRLRNRRFTTLFGAREEDVRIGMTLPETLAALTSARFGPERRSGLRELERLTDRLRGSVKGGSGAIDLGEGLIVATEVRPLADGGWVATYEAGAVQETPAPDGPKAAMPEALAG